MENDLSFEDLSLESIGKEVAANIKDSKVYHASPVKVSKLSGKKTGSWSGEQGNVFVTPCKGIAACFLINKDEIIDALREQQNIDLRGQKLNFGYDVWNKPISTLYSIPSTVKVLLNVRGIKSFKGKAQGYLYTIDYSKYSDKTHMFNKNKDSDAEFLIEGDVTPISCESVAVNYEVVSDEESIKRHGDATPSITRKENMEESTYESFIDEGLQLIDEFNAGCEEFNTWAKNLELSQVNKNTSDPSLKHLTYSLAQENILTDTVKDIFNKIAQFIGWFWNKLKQLWNFFFGKMQRNIRLFNSNLSKIKAHKASGKFFNEEAFNKSTAPTNLLNAYPLIDLLQQWDPDRFHEAFSLLYNKFKTNILELSDLLEHGNEPTSPFNIFGSFGGMLASDKNNKTPVDIVSYCLSHGGGCNGTMFDCGYEGSEAVFAVSETTVHIIESYKKNSKLIESQGNLGAEAARRMMDLEDRVDITQEEASTMASKTQKLTNVVALLSDRYHRSFMKMLEQALILQTVYMKYMQ